MNHHEKIGAEIHKALLDSRIFSISIRDDPQSSNLIEQKVESSIVEIRNTYKLIGGDSIAFMFIDKQGFERPNPCSGGKLVVIPIDCRPPERNISQPDDSSSETDEPDRTEIGCVYGLIGVAVLYLTGAVVAFTWFFEHYILRIEQ
jgi:hypothetical protein